MAHRFSLRRNNRHLVFIAGLFVIGIYVIIPQLSGFHRSWQLVGDADTVWVAVAILMTFMTFLAAAGTYRLLAFKHVPYPQLVLVQLAAMCVNKLLPGGIGAVGANYAYLRHRRHDALQAGGVVAVNNLLGIVGHICVLAVTLLLFSKHIVLNDPWNRLALWQVILAAGIVSLLVVLLISFRRNARLSKALKEARQQLASYRSRPGNLLAALATSICLTLFNMFCLAACATALGLHLPFLTLLVVFSLGLSVGTATPTPGGLGGFEAGMVSSLVAYHVAASAALALALLYRLVSYWLPLMTGAIAFIVCQKQKLFTAT